MRRTQFIGLTFLFIFFNINFGHSQTPASYAEDEVVIIFQEDITQEEIDDVLEEFAMYIESGPTPYTKAYLLKFESTPPDWAYLNAIDPINGIVERAKTQPTTNGVGLNYELTQPSIFERGGIPPNPNVCNTIFGKNATPNGINSVDAAIFDTGITMNPNVISEFFNLNNLGINYINALNAPIDDNDHGTHISSIIMENLKNDNSIIELSAHKTHDEDGLGTVYRVIEALDRNISDGVKIVNMSFSYNVDYEYRFDQMAPLSIAIDKARSIGGILCIAAAGNEGVDNDDINLLSAYPASFLNDNIIAVASVDCDKNKSVWSNFGVRSVDITAPGQEVWGYDKNGEYISMSGTSQATAFVTKTAVYLATHQDIFNYVEIKCAILNGAINLQTNPFVLSNGFISPRGALTVLNSNDPCNPNFPGRDNRLAIPQALTINQVISGDVLNIEISTQYSGTANLMISNVLGEVLLNEKINLRAGTEQYNFNFIKPSDQALYFITVTQEDEMTTFKFR